nr:MAG TPA_asm: hypothetical protein [Caudoviricetes sp.]
MSATISPVLQPHMFSSQFAVVSLFSSAETVTLAIRRGSETIFSATYYTYNRSVAVYDLDRVFEEELDAEEPDALPYDEFTIVIDGVAAAIGGVKVFRCDYRLHLDATKYLGEFYLTSGHGERDTALGRKELLPVYDADGEAAVAVCTYADNDTHTLSRVTKQLGNVVNFVELDVSPAIFDDQPLKNLISYEIQCGRRRQRYRVLDLPQADPVISFVNRFGCRELLYFAGSKTTTVAYTRDNVNVNSAYRVYHIDEIVSHEAQTGPLRPSMVAVATDLARAKDVWLYDIIASAEGDSIAITAADIKYTNEDHAIADFALTYRLTRRRTMQGDEATRALRVFDNTFDSTYE